MKRAKNIVFILILIALCAPAIQQATHLIRIKPLQGDFIEPAKPAFSWDEWFDGNFQPAFEIWLEYQIGFRNILVRLNNQVDFTFFGEAHAEGVIVGKKRELYEYDYIRAYIGKDFVGDSFIETKMRRLKYLQEYLKAEKGIDLLLVFEPGKASVIPEHIPQKFLSEKNNPTNYLRYSHWASELDVRHLDLNRYFIEIKEMAEYPLYPPSGIHWSIYGMSLAADTLLKTIEELQNINLPDYNIINQDVSRKPQRTDYDVGAALNLLFPIPGPELAYPEYTFPGEKGTRPDVLAVADSYYWNIYNTAIPEHLFKEAAYWYFNALVFPETYFDTLFVENIDFESQIKDRDVILLMMTERFMYKFDWMFTDMLYELYTPSDLWDPLYLNANRPLNVDSWFNEIIQEAEDKGTSNEEILWENAEFLLSEDQKATYLSWFGPDHFIQNIRQSESWLAMIEEQAKEKGKPLEEMIRSNAEYAFKNDFPKIAERYYGIKEIIVDFSKNGNPQLADSMLALQNRYYLKSELALRVAAERAFNEMEITNIEKNIINSPDWLAHVKQKAKEHNITVSEMLRQDAEYVFYTDLNEIFGNDVNTQRLLAN